MDWHSDPSGDPDHAGTTTLVELTALTATPGPYKMLLSWETAAEIDPAGFHLWRSETELWGYERITGLSVPAKGGPTQGATYAFEDAEVQPGKAYFYKLEDIDTQGRNTFHGPVAAKTLTEREDATPVPTLTGGGLFAGGAILAGAGAAFIRRRRNSSGG